MNWLCSLLVLSATVLLAACTAGEPTVTLPPPTPTATPDYQATVDVAVRATVEAILASTPTPTPSPTSTPTLSAPVGLIAKVIRVIDGATVEVVFQDGSTDRVRLLGVDTPETSSQNKAYEYGYITDTACLDDWGQLATEYATQQLEGRTVTLVPDPASGEMR